MENGFDYETPATTLASHFYAAMKSFFKDNLWNLDPMVYVQFHDGLEDIFTSALKLKAWTCLDPTAFSFQWPDADSPFDPATMKDDNENIDDSGNGIRLSLFAAWTRLHSDANTTTIVDLDPTERCIARAVVLLQHLPRQCADSTRWMGRIMFFAMWDLSDNRWCLLLMATRTLEGDCYSIGVYGQMATSADALDKKYQ